jgi:hypothetical protein
MLIHAAPPAPPAISKKLVYAHGLPVAWLVTHHKGGKTWTVRVRITTTASSDNGGFASPSKGMVVLPAFTTAVSKTVGKRDNGGFAGPISGGSRSMPSNAVVQGDNGGFAGRD